MKTAMLRMVVAGTCVAGLLALMANAGVAQAGAGLHLYDGGILQGSGVDALTWGSGEVKEVEDHAFTGVRSLRLKTQGPAQGLRIVLAQPVDLTAAAADPSIYMRIGVKLEEEDTTKNPAATLNQITRKRDETDTGIGFGGGGRNSSAKGGYNSATGQTNGSRANLLLVKPKPITAVRAVFVTSDGKECEAYLPLSNASYQRDDWRYVAVPIAKIANIDGTNKQLKEVRVFGDSVGTIYIGDVSTVHDITPINVGDLPEQTVAVNDIVTLTGSADAGNTQLKYEWTVMRADDPGATGPPPAVPDLEGRTVRFYFRKSGDYTVTLKVSDVNGIKKPATVQTKVTVTL